MILIGLVISCSTTLKTREGNPPSSSESNGKIISPEGLGLCLYRVDQGFKTMGCTIEGPIQGELFGTVLARNMDFEDALSFCVAHPDCSGISTPFNAGVPFQAVGKSERFLPSEASYACSVLVHSCPR